MWQDAPFIMISAAKSPDLQLAVPRDPLYTGNTSRTAPRISRPVREAAGEPCLARFPAEIGHTPLRPRYPVGYQ